MTSQCGQSRGLDELVSCLPHHLIKAGLDISWEFSLGQLIENRDCTLADSSETGSSRDATIHTFALLSRSAFHIDSCSGASGSGGGAGAGTVLTGVWHSSDFTRHPRAAAARSGTGLHYLACVRHCC